MIFWLMVPRSIWQVVVGTWALVLTKVVVGRVPVDMKQRYIIKFLVRKNVKLAKVLRMLSEQSLSHEKVYEW